MIIQLENISKSYVNESSTVKREVLKNVSFSMDRGDVMSIVGPSGSGKSTLLNIIGTLDRPDSGNLSFDGTSINKLSDNELAELRNRKIGFVFQSHHLLPQLNILDNILLPTLANSNKEEIKNARDRAVELLDYVGLSDRMKQLPNQLSGGESQRVAVVRALINQADLILADEPTGSLDAESANKIGELLSKINKERSVSLILVTHSIKLSQRIGNVHNIINGKLIKK